MESTIGIMRTFILAVDEENMSITVRITAIMKKKKNNLSYPIVSVVVMILWES